MQITKRIEKRTEYTRPSNRRFAGFLIGTIISVSIWALSLLPSTHILAAEGSATKTLATNTSVATVTTTATNTETLAFNPLPTSFYISLIVLIVAVMVLCFLIFTAKRKRIQEAQEKKRRLIRKAKAIKRRKIEEAKRVEADKRLKEEQEERRKAEAKAKEEEQKRKELEAKQNATPPAWTYTANSSTSPSWASPRGKADGSIAGIGGIVRTPRAIGITGMSGISGISEISRTPGGTPDNMPRKGIPSFASEETFQAKRSWYPREASDIKELDITDFSDNISESVPEKSGNLGTGGRDKAVFEAKDFDMRMAGFSSIKETDKTFF